LDNFREGATEIKVKTVILASLLGALLLSSCRPSSALVDTVYTQDVPEVDTRSQVNYIDNSADNTEKNDDLSPEEINDESTDPRERERKNAVPGDGDDGGSAPDIRHDDNASSDFKPSSGAPEGLGVGDSGDEPQQSADDGAQDVGIIGAGGVTVRDGARREIENAYGDIVDIPENVETVAATGEAALIVRMLGGGGRLAATSESFAASALARTVFGSGSADVKNALWGGNGSSPLSNEKFSALLEAGPQVCFEISGQRAFSEAQIARLRELGIGYVALPALTTHSGILLAVRIVGEALGEVNGVDARAAAKEYAAFSASVLAKAASAGKFSPDGINYDTGEADASSSGGGIYSLYIGGWDGGAHYTLHDDSSVTLEGAGLPVAVTGYTASPMSYYMSLAGVANAAALRENNYSAILPKARYVSPIHTANKALSVSGGYAEYDAGYVFTTAGGKYLGDAAFPAVIAESAAVRDGILANSLWKNYGAVTSASGLTNGYGFPDKSGDIVSTTVHGPYEVFVNPRGVGSWTEGSVESVLEPLWIAWRLTGSVSEAEMRDALVSFYAKFYGYALSAAETDDILAGNRAR
jgi:ABC-type Fe3+-hydroxamate transport system substrate-binding protein